MIYKWVYVALVFVGATVSLNFVWNLSDAFNGLMAIPNLIALLALCPLIFSMLRDYEAKATSLDRDRSQAVDFMRPEPEESEG